MVAAVAATAMSAAAIAKDFLHDGPDIVGDFQGNQLFRVSDIMSCLNSSH